VQGPGSKPAAEGPGTEANSSGSIEAQVSHVLDNHNDDDDDNDNDWDDCDNDNDSSTAV